MTECIKEFKAEIRRLEQEQELAELEARNYELRTRSAFTPSSNNGTPYLLPSQCRSSTGKITSWQREMPWLWLAQSLQGGHSPRTQVSLKAQKQRRHGR